MNTNQTTPVGRDVLIAPSHATEQLSGARGATRPTRAGQFCKQHRTWLVPAALLVILAGLFVARTAFAKIMNNTIDPVGIVSDKGRHLTLTGPIGMGDGTVFRAGETADLRVTVTQRTTGAVAEGSAIIVANGALQQWEVRATTFSKAAFAPGPATAVAVGVTTTKGGVATDAHQWLVNITLVSE